MVSKTRSDLLLVATDVAQRHIGKLRAQLKDSPFNLPASPLELDGFSITHALTTTDPDFFRLSVCVADAASSQCLVELISLVEKP